MSTHRSRTRSHRPGSHILALVSRSARWPSDSRYLTLQCRAPARLPRLPRTGARGAGARARYGNGCATPASLTGHGPKAGHAPTFTPEQDREAARRQTGRRRRVADSGHNVWDDEAPISTWQ
jgi:hypothetical protein